MEEQLIKYLNDELSSEERSEVEKRLTESADWRKMLTELQTVFSVMEAVEFPTPSTESTTRFADFLNQEITKTETPAAKVVKMPFRLWQVAAAVALLLQFDCQQLKRGQRSRNGAVFDNQRLRVSWLLLQHVDHHCARKRKRSGKREACRAPERLEHAHH